MDYQKQIEEVITQALTEKSFNLEIIDKIKKLKDGFEEAQEDLTEKNEQIEGLNKTISTLQAVQVEYNKRKDQLAEKEAKLSKTEYELDFQRQRANEIKELFGTVFRNPVILRSRTGNVPVMVPGQTYPSSAFSFQ